MKKAFKFFVASFFATQLSASIAQIQIEPLGNRDINYRIERRLEKLVDLIQRDRAHLAMYPQAKEVLLKNINFAIDSIVGNAGPGPGPNPNPYPNPTPFPPARILEVTALVEDFKLTLLGATVGEIFTQCMDSYPASSSSVDEIAVVANNSRVVWLYNRTSTYGDKGSVCSLISQNVNVSTVNQPVGYITVNGAFEQSNFTLSGDSKAKILSQCFDAFQSSSHNGLDEIYVAVGKLPMVRLYNQKSYWNQASSACNQVMEVVDTSFP
ncbi:MAG: hypothetical protein QE271_10300 [Bacteriovoracaceae bacterium]|nr:hypothetical protein [Bacteriovoracaceae bacterium]